MARELTNPVSDPTYLEFFGMTRPPFAQVSGPSPIFLSEQYAILMSHLASATEQTDCLMVICGANGSGKTTLLNRYITSLSDEVSFAAFDETCTTGTDFYCTLLEQLGFAGISGTLRELRRITHEFLIQLGKSGDPVLLIIDNAHLISPSVYEQLRWISETKIDDRRVVSIVLAGNSDLPRIMESPAMRSIKFRSHINFNIRVYTEEETEDYVRHRLRLAGGMDAAKFSNDARPLIYELTGGIPNSINMLCNEVLTEAYARETRVISANLVRTVADNFEIKPPKVAPKRKGRRKTDPEFKLVLPDPQQEARITARGAQSRETAPRTARTPQSPDVDTTELLEQVARLSEQLGKLKAEGKQALLDIGARDKEISKLQKKLAEQIKKTEKQADAAGDNANEIRRLRKEFAESTKALKQSEKASSKLTTDLEKKEAALNRAKMDVVSANEKIERLDDIKAELQASVGDLTADVKLANRHVAEFDAVENSLEESQRECDALRLRITDLENEVASYSKEFTENREQLSNAAEQDADEIRRLKKELSDSARALEQSEKASKSLAAELKEEGAALKRARENIAQANEKIEKLDKKKAELQVSLGELTADVEQANERVVQTGVLESSLEESQNECDALRLRITELENELASYSKEFTENREQLSNAAEQDAAEIRRLKKELSDSARALEQSEKASKSLATDLKEEEAALMRAREDMAQANEKIEKLDQKKAELQVSLDELTADVEQANERVVQTEVLESSLEESRNKCDALRLRVTELENELASHSKDFSENRKQLSQAAANKADENQKLQRELSQTEKALVESERLSNELRAELKKEIGARKHAHTDATKAQSRIEKLNDTKAKLEASVSELTADVKQAKNHVAKFDALENSLDESQRECESLRSSMAKLEAELASHIKESKGKRAKQSKGQKTPKSSKSKRKGKGKSKSSDRSTHDIKVLEVTKNGKVEAVVPIADIGPRIMIGRSEDSDLCLDSKFVSRHHALVFCTDALVYIEDLNSFNGTIVNSETVTHSHLYPDDSVAIGDFVIRPRSA